MVTATKNFVPWHCIYFESFKTKLQANLRELEIKKKKSRKYIEWLFQNGNSNTSRYKPHSKPNVQECDATMLNKNILPGPKNSFLQKFITTKTRPASS
jgi:hypothetical protein